MSVPEVAVTNRMLAAGSPKPNLHLTRLFPRGRPGRRPLRLLRGLGVHFRPELHDGRHVGGDHRERAGRPVPVVDFVSLPRYLPSMLR